MKGVIMVWSDDNLTIFVTYCFICTWFNRAIVKLIYSIFLQQAIRRNCPLQI